MASPLSPLTFLAVLAGSTAATLIARLVNNDTDTTHYGAGGANVYPECQPRPLPKRMSIRQNPPQQAPLDLTQLQDLSSQFKVNFGRSSHNDQATTYYVGLSLTNTNQYLFKGGLAVVVSGISDPSIKLANADGTTADGFSYIDFHPSRAWWATLAYLKRPHSTRSLAFLNPNHIQFTYHLSVLGDPDHSPVFSGTPSLTAYQGTAYTSTESRH